MTTAADCSSRTLSRSVLAQFELGQLELLAQAALQSTDPDVRRNAVAVLGLVEKYNRTQPLHTEVRMQP